MEAEDAHLVQKMKDLGEKVADTNKSDANMGRRLKEYHANNPDGETVKDLFTDLLGYNNVLPIDATIPAEDQQVKMQEIIEQKGKPCCINMISEEDRKFLANLDRLAAKEARAKARAEAAIKAAEAAEGASNEEPPADAVAEAVESEEEVDEVEALLEKQR